MEVFDLSKNRPLMSASTPKTSSTLDKTPRAAADPMAVIGLSKHDATATGTGRGLVTFATYHKYEDDQPAASW